MKKTLAKMQQQYEAMQHLPPFEPMNRSVVYLINGQTDLQRLHEVIELAKEIRYLSMDTEADLLSHRPSLIQIEFIDYPISTVILVEVAHLPTDRRSLKFWLIRSIFKFIFHGHRTLYCWGDGFDELRQFIGTGLFTDEQLADPQWIDLQEAFGLWYGRPSQGGDKWGLQKAILHQFDEALDKRERLNRWSVSLSKSSSPYPPAKIDAMIEYATNDCLALTRLAHALGLEIFS